MNTAFVEHVKSATEWALEQTDKIENMPNTPGEGESRPIWPLVLSISNLAYVAARAIDNPSTAACALGVGMQVGRRRTPEMIGGAAVHKALLPKIAAYLQSYNPRIEYILQDRDLSLRGRIDVFCPGTGVIELKTTWTQKYSPGAYERIQASLYYKITSLPVIVVLIDVPGWLLSGWWVVDSDAQAERALEMLPLYRAYATAKIFPPQRDCTYCFCNKWCPVPRAHLCPTCQTSLEEGLVWVSSDFGVHSCGQAVKKHQGETVPVRASGHKLVRMRPRCPGTTPNGSQD